MKKVAKRSVCLGALSVPIAYLISRILHFLVMLLRYLVEILLPEKVAVLAREMLPYIDTGLCVLALVISINVVAILLYWSAQKT